jgi:hypothetical protein
LIFCSFTLPMVEAQLERVLGKFFFGKMSCFLYSETISHDSFLSL